MSITTALAGLKTASDLTTRLREALKAREVQLDEVVARIIEIQDLISDGRTQLIDSQDQIIQKNAEIQQLRVELAALKARVQQLESLDGEPCPRCHKRGWSIVASRADPIFGALGKARRTYQCSFCGFTEDKV